MRDPGVMLHTLKGWVAVTPEFAAGFLDIHPTAEHFDIELDEYTVFADDKPVRTFSAGGYIPTPDPVEPPDTSWVTTELIGASPRLQRAHRAEENRLNAIAHQQHLDRLALDEVSRQTSRWVRDFEKHSNYFVPSSYSPPPTPPVELKPTWEQPPPAPAFTITTSKASPLYHRWTHMAISTSGCLLGAAFVLCIVTGNWPWMFVPAGLFGLLLGWAQAEQEHMARVHTLVAAALKPQDR